MTENPEPSALGTEPKPSSRAQQDSLFTPSFVGLLLTQTLTAINDNVFRWLVIGIAKDSVDARHFGIILTTGTVCFVLPYLLLAAPAGFLADRFSKRSVIVGCKAAEIVVMLLGVGAVVLAGHSDSGFYLLFVVIIFTGAQSALFSPAKAGIIPEMLTASKIPAANGAFGLATVAATVIGMGLGSWIADIVDPETGENILLAASIIVGMAVVGTLCSLAITRVPPANPTRRFPWDAPVQSYRDLKMLTSNGPLFRVALGMVFFWSVGLLAQLNIDQLSFESGALDEFSKFPLLVSLVMGVGVGSVLAAIWSGGRVELGILPIGAFGVAAFSGLLFTVEGALFHPDAPSTPALGYACAALFGLGISAGLFSIPLEAFMQHRSPKQHRGAILSATNLIVFGGMLVASMLYTALRVPQYGASLADIDPAMRGLPLTAQQQRHVEELKTRFQAEWDAFQKPDPFSGRDSQPQLPDIGKYLDQAGPHERRETLAQLLWIDFAKRREHEYSQPAEAYKGLTQNAHESALLYRVSVEAADPLLRSRQIFLLFGLLTIPVFLYVVFLIPQASIRFLVWLASHTVYRIRVQNREALPEEGGALLAANHITWMDGVLLMLTSSRLLRIVAHAENFSWPSGPPAATSWMRKLAKFWGVILIDPKRPKQTVAALNTATEALNNGELVCIFPEGGISRTGQILSFRPGVMKIVEKTVAAAQKANWPEGQAPVVPVYLDELWGSIFSFERGKFFWKRPKHWPYPLTIHFGQPISDLQDVHQLRRAVQNLGAKAVQQRSDRFTVLPRLFIRQCKARRRMSKVADSMGSNFTGAELLLRTLILRRLLRRHTLASDEKFVGVLLPPSGGGVIANVALTLDRRVPVNLNYTMSSETLNYCLGECGAKHVLTSRRFMSKMSFDLDTEIVYLEDFKDKVTTADKVASAAAAFVTPAAVLERALGLHRISTDDVMTVIFTSGSTGRPKGVMLTHANIASNVDAIDQVIRLNRKDVLLGILPFFHSLGFTVTIWGVAGLDIKGAYHFSPLDARQIGRLCKEHQGTLMLSTPTFLRGFLRRCDKEDFATLDVVVTGAEKLPVDVADAFEEKFGVRPVEGYGTTELSPLVSVNIPPSRRSPGEKGSNLQVDCKEATVGRPAPGVAAKVLDLDSGAELGADAPGMLWITGPNVMKGYLNQEEKTAEVIQDGWYKTGDVALIDKDGFIKITGRISRFSKIGGEMVPHGVVEEAINRILGAGTQDGVEELKAAVTAVDDPKKGEKLMVIHIATEKTPDEICQALTEQEGLPNLYIPGKDCFHQVEQLPVLGTGKVALKEVKEIAMSLVTS